MLSIINNNPFRVLGVFSNTPKRELIRNINKINAFLEVGKEISFPFDNIPNLDNCDRSKSKCEEAQKSIERSLDAIKASMFWFFNITPIDKIAFNHVKSGNFDNAINIWSKVENVSSLQNRCVCYLILKRWKEAAITNDILFTKYPKEFCSIIDETLELSSEELINTFFECISYSNNEILMQFYESFSVYEENLGFECIEFETSDLWEKSLYVHIAKPIIKDLEKKVKEVRAIPHKDAIQRKKGAEILLTESKLHYVQLLGEDSPEYISIASKVIPVALQCIIDYYNYSKDQEDAAKEAKRLTEYAFLMSPQGTLVRQRCEDNLKTLDKICSELPPKKVSYYHKLLKNRINAFSQESATIKNANQFILDCVPYLISIRTVLGSKDKYYLKMSTLVADDALSDLISSYNEKSDELFPKLKSSSGFSKSLLIQQIKDFIKEALIATYHIKELDLDNDFREKRLNPNFEVIFKQAKETRALSLVPDDALNEWTRTVSYAMSDSDVNMSLLLYKLDKRDEKGLAESVQSTSDCNNYLRLFPGGKYTKSVLSKKERFTYNECKSVDDIERFKESYPNSTLDIAGKYEEIRFTTCKTLDDYKSYISAYPSGKYLDQAKQKIDDLTFKACKSQNDYEKYINDFPYGAHRNEAYNKIEYFIFNKCKYLSDYEQYLKQFPQGKYSNTAKSRIEEEKLWLKCKKKKSWKVYKEYISKFPRGRYASEARSKSTSPSEKIKELIKNNGCLFTVIIIAIIVLGIAAITNGISGAGYALGAIGILTVLFALKNEDEDFGCGSRLACIGIGVLAGIIAFILISIGENKVKESEAKLALEQLGDNPSIGDYHRFFRIHSNYIDENKKNELLGKYYNNTLDSCYSTIKEYSERNYSRNPSGLGYLKEFINSCNDGKYRRNAESKMTDIVDSLYSVAEKKNTYEGWEEYQQAVPSDEYRDSEEKKQARDTRWSTEANAWTSAKELNTITAYEKYLDLFPNGAHKAAADKKIIDLRVESTFAGSHGVLPAMDKTGYGGPVSYISVYNNTSYNLTLFYSGTESKRLVISPHSTGSLKLKNGSYRIAASVDASNVGRYGGAEKLNGGSYEVEYYISSIPQRY